VCASPDETQSDDPWDALAERYADFAEIMAHVNPATPEWIASNIQAWAADRSGPHSAIDIGCGSGVYTRLLANVCTTVKGYDPSAGMVEIAAVRNNHPHITYLHGPPSRDARADVVLCTFAAHHINPAPMTAYAWLRTLVQPGGLVLIVDVITDARKWRMRHRHIDRAHWFRSRVLDATGSAYDAQQVYSMMTSREWLDSVIATVPPSESEMMHAALTVMPGAIWGRLADGVGSIAWVAP
jgi:SAM-dependent methyltransferase